MNLPVLKLHESAMLPTRAYPDDAGLDIYNLEDIALEVGAGVTAQTGIAMALPPQHVGIITDRSSLAKRGIKTAGGIIDAGYRGELRIILWNLSKERQLLTKGERIAQLMIVPIQTPTAIQVTELPPSSRGEKGFGSSGR